MYLSFFFFLLDSSSFDDRNMLQKMKIGSGENAGIEVHEMFEKSGVDL